MEDLRNAVNFVLNIVSSISEIPGIKVVRDYPAIIKDNPLNEIVVSYGISSLESTSENPDYPGSIITDIKVSFTIHAPLTYSGEDCQDIYVKIIEKLHSETNFFYTYGCSNPEFNRSASTLVLEGWGIYRDIFLLP